MRLVTGCLALCIATSALAAATIQVPSGVTEEATSYWGAVVTYNVTATGNGQGDDENGRPINSAAITCSPASGTQFAYGATTVTCTARDSESTATGTFVVNVVDTTAPVLVLPNDIVVKATSPNGAGVTYSAAARDNTGGNPSCSPYSGSVFPIGTTLVVCTASDRANNKTTGSFSVTVESSEPPPPPPPSNPPTLSLPDDITAEATGPAGAVVTYSATANGGGGADDENGRPTDGSTVTCSPASGSTFALGTTTVNCSATNSAGTTTGSFEVTVVDTTAPALRLPRDFTVHATSNDGIAVTYDASATDAVDGNVAVSCSPASGSTFPVGTTSVDCSATDAAGNTASGGFAVTVTAPNPPPPPPADPKLNLPDDITVEADGPNGAIVTFTATVTGGGSGTGDDENGRPTGGNPTVTCAPPSGSLFALGTTTVQCSAGSLSGTFLVHVVDTTAPVLSLPADITTAETTVTFTATATDLVDGNVAASCTPPSGSTFSAGTTTVNCSASDAAGNSASGSFSVTVTDTPPPARTVTITATPDKIWPPNKGLVAVTINVEISDGSSFSAHITSVASSENDPNDRTSPDWVITGPLTLNLRAEKSEQAQERVYTIEVEVIDDADNVYVDTVTVSVANDGSASDLLNGKILKRKTKNPTVPARPRRG